MKNSALIRKIITSALLITSLTACGEVSEVPANNSSVAETETTAEPSSENSVAETKSTTEPSSEISVAETESTTEPSSEISVAETKSTTEPSSEISVAETESTTEPSSEISVAETESTTEPSEENSVPESKTYQTAYIQKATELDDGNCKFNLIYFDDDDIPELVVGADGFYTSLYTYSNGEIYTLMEHWGYGAMGNAGYEYVPGKNSLRNYDSDFAGAIRYTTYMAISENHSMDTVAQIETFNFDDVNENGIPDEDESESIGKYKKSYIDGKEISDEEIEKYNAGQYEFISVAMTLEELKNALS